MPMSASLSIQSLRADQRRLSHGPLMPRLWQTMRDEWQRRLDRATARAVRELGHEGVNEDYRMACRGSYR